MYVERVPNRKSPPAVLLREFLRQHGKVKRRTLANLSKCPDHVVDGLQILLKGGIALRSNDAFSIIHSYPHGHVATVLGSLKKLGLHTLISRSSSRPRDLVVAMIVASSTPAPNWPPRAPSPRRAPAPTLRQALRLGTVWLAARQQGIEQRLARHHLSDNTLMLYVV